MLFTSFSFYGFALVVLVLSRWLPFRFSRLVLIAASYLFYGAAEAWYCLILFSSTLVDFIAARRIAGAGTPIARKRWLWTSILVNLSLLSLFKYANFTADNLNIILSWMGVGPLPHIDLILPIGISFYTFQTLSYTIDVYRRKQEPTRDFASFALYVAFFPQLVAGPIERARKLLPQFERQRRATLADIEYGVQRILWGVAKKTIFADRFAVVVAQVYRDPAAYSSPELMLATLCFSFQLYLDFSAYTDIAIGLARLFGIRLSENFNYPFLARNPSDFWARWHITLTSWFRDYVYRSVGGTRRGAPVRTAAAIMLVMGLMGLWHGAEWHFVVFGLLSGVMVVYYVTIRLLTGRRRLLGNSWWATILSILIMNIVINLIMVFFRAPDLATAGWIIAGMFGKDWHIDSVFYLPAAMLSLAILFHIYFGTRRMRLHDIPMHPMKKGLLMATLLLSINYLAIDATQTFMYFRF